MKKLTARYSFTQFFYWMGICGGGTFATIFLLDKGMSSGVVGTLLAAAGLISALTQPVIAAPADRAKKFVVPRMLEVMALLCCLCYALQLLPGLPVMISGIIYAVAIWLSGAMASLMNSLTVGYEKAGYTIDYGTGRGIGAAATALSSLILGFLISKLGTQAMLLYVFAAWALFFITVLGYPYIDKPESRTGADESCGVLEFFVRYKRYCVSLAGIMFLGMCHNMTETYMIRIMNMLGGDSSNVGVALFISAAVTFPVICIYGRIHSRVRVSALLKLAGAVYVIKAVCFYFAGNITQIYVFQLLQILTYALLEPSQVYYSKASVDVKDMTKGQAFIAASFALGGSIGNFAGGQLLRSGTGTMLAAGIVMASAGALILACSAGKAE